MRKRTVMNRKWHADPKAMLRLVSKVQPFTEGEIVALETPVRLAWESLKTGKATEADFHTLAGAVNVALVRSEDINPLAVEVCNRAAEALMSVWARFQRSRVWGVDYLALNHLPTAIDLYEQLLELSTPMQMQEAMNTTIKRMNDGHVLGASA
jgi:hypothetical protein